MFEKFEFERLSGSGAGRLVNCIGARLQNNGMGRLVIANNIFIAMGEPEYITFHLDKESKLVGLKAARGNDLHCRKLVCVKGGHARQVSCSQLAKILGATVGSRCIFPAHYDADKGMVIASYADLDTGSGGR